MKNYKRALRLFLRWLAFILILVALAAVIIFIARRLPRNETSLTIGVAALSALFSAVSGLAALVQAIEFRQQRRELERPHVVTFFDRIEGGQIRFVVMNIGGSPALNISLKVTNLSTTNGSLVQNQMENLKLQNIPLIAPQKEIAAEILQAAGELLDDAKFAIEITYQARDGGRYRETNRHDLQFLDHIYVSDRSRPFPPISMPASHNRPEVEKAVEHIVERTLQRIINTRWR